MKKAVKPRLSKYLSVCVLSLVSLAALAQEPQVDSLNLATPRKEGTPDFRDARAYSMQRRFRSRDAVPFRSDGFFDNTFVALSLGRDNTFRPEFADGMETSVLAGKWISAFHGVRAALVFAEGKDNYDGSRNSKFGLRGSYLCDLSHYLLGYNPNRFLDLSVVAGVGAFMQKYNQKSAVSLSAHLGADFTFRAFRNVSFYVEPMLNVAYDPGLIVHDINWKKYVPAFNLSAGMVCNFRNADYEPTAGFERLYAFAGGGAVLHNNFTNREASGVFSGIGMTVNAGVGFNCLEWLGFRTSAQFARCSWDSDPGHGIRVTSYFALRIEAVFDILPAFNPTLADSHFGFAIFLGPETGYLRKLDGDLVINSWYTGATGGLQLRYEVVNDLSICLEPRVTVIPYSAPTDKPAPQKYWERNYYDGLLSLSLGIQYRLK